MVKRLRLKSVPEDEDVPSQMNSSPWPSAPRAGPRDASGATDVPGAGASIDVQRRRR